MHFPFIVDMRLPLQLSFKLVATDGVRLLGINMQLRRTTEADNNPTCFCLPQWEMGFEFCKGVHKQPWECEEDNDLKAEFYTGEQRDLNS